MILLLEETWKRFLEKHRERKELEERIKKTKDLKKTEKLWERYEKNHESLEQIKEKLIDLTEYENFFQVDTKREIVVAKKRIKKEKFYQKLLNNLGFNPTPELEEKFFPVYLKNGELVPLYDKKFNSPHGIVLEN